MSTYIFDEDDNPEYREMDEYYNRPVTVDCSYCRLEQTAPTATLIQIGWDLSEDGNYCFQAACIRDRQPVYAMAA